MRETLIQLRQVMEQKHVDIVLIPSSDFHGSEYIGDYFKARAWMSGFGLTAVTLFRRNGSWPVRGLLYIRWGRKA